MKDWIVIDKERCTGCGYCVSDCPGHALRLQEGKAAWMHSCITCGHCVAICPVSAVSIPGYDMDDVEEYGKEGFSIDPEIFLRAVKFRRSVRRFDEKPVSRQAMERILEAGRYTATARNLQGTSFLVVQEGLLEFKDLFWKEFPDILKALETTRPEYVPGFLRLYKRWKENPADDGFFFNTTGLILVVTENPLDGGLAASNMENMAVAEGAGVLYSGYLQRTIPASAALMEWLGIEGRTIACCMLVGIPAVRYQRTAPRKKADVRWL